MISSRLSLLKDHHLLSHHCFLWGRLWAKIWSNGCFAGFYVSFFLGGRVLLLNPEWLSFYWSQVTLPDSLPHVFSGFFHILRPFLVHNFLTFPQNYKQVPPKDGKHRFHFHIPRGPQNFNESSMRVVIYFPSTEPVTHGATWHQSPSVRNFKGHIMFIVGHQISRQRSFP